MPTKPEEIERMLTVKSMALISFYSYIVYCRPLLTQDFIQQISTHFTKIMYVPTLDPAFHSKFLNLIVFSRKTANSLAVQYKIVSVPVAKKTSDEPPSTAHSSTTTSLTLLLCRMMNRMFMVLTALSENHVIFPGHKELWEMVTSILTNVTTASSLLSSSSTSSSSPSSSLGLPYPLLILPLSLSSKFHHQNSSQNVPQQILLDTDILWHGPFTTPCKVKVHEDDVTKVSDSGDGAGNLDNPFSPFPGNPTPSALSYPHHPSLLETYSTLLPTHAHAFEKNLGEKDEDAVMDSGIGGWMSNDMKILGSYCAYASSHWLSNFEEKEGSADEIPAKKYLPSLLKSFDVNMITLSHDISDRSAVHWNFVNFAVSFLRNFVDKNEAKNSSQMEKIPHSILFDVSVVESLSFIQSHIESFLLPIPASASASPSSSPSSDLCTSMNTNFGYQSYTRFLEAAATALGTKKRKETGREKNREKTRARVFATEEKLMTFFLGLIGRIKGVNYILSVIEKITRNLQNFQLQQNGKSTKSDSSQTTNGNSTTKIVGKDLERYLVALRVLYGWTDWNSILLQSENKQNNDILVNSFKVRRRRTRRGMTGKKGGCDENLLCVY
jgi:hypothetical protein